MESPSPRGHPSPAGLEGPFSPSVWKLPPAPNLLHECEASQEKLPVPGGRLDVRRVPRAISAHISFLFFFSPFFSFCF